MRVEPGLSAAVAESARPHRGPSVSIRATVLLGLAVSAGWRQGRVLNADQAGKSGSPDVRHERDRPLAMSCESVASGATQNQLPIAAGISAKQATNIHLSGRSTARIMPTIATVATHVDNTRSFR